MRSGIVALLTDFGRDDWYVGVMKGVVAGINPGARLVDITHAVPPQDVLAASFALLASRRFFPPGTVFASVVDPGVGGPRRILCARSQEKLYLAPDNGLLTEVLDADGLEEAVSVENKSFFSARPSPTFHGRDIFAPVAAHLSLGVEAALLGPRVTQLARCEVPAPRVDLCSAELVVRWVDSFGNLITNCSGDLARQLAAAWGGVLISAAGREGIRLAETYQWVGVGDLAGIVGSSEYLEVSVREGSAARALGLGIGSRMTLRRP